MGKVLSILATISVVIVIDCTDVKKGKNNKIFTDDYTVNNSLCKILFPSSLILLKHHKTGTVLSRHLRANLISFCDIIYKSQKQQDYHNWLEYTNFRESGDESNDKLQGDAGDNLRFHFWRDPVLTIVSGFNYHMNCTEEWASRPITTKYLNQAATFFGFETDYDKLYKMYMNLTWTFDIDSEIPVWINLMTDKQRIAANKSIEMKNNNNAYAKKIRMLYYYYMNDIVNQVRLNKYGDYYGFDIDFDDTDIHSKYNMFAGDDEQRLKKFDKFVSITGWYSQSFTKENTIKYGLYFEMLRYLFVIYPEIYSYHFDLIRDTENDYEFKMETWNTDFGANLDIFLDKLNLIDTEENRQKLKDHGISNIDISKEREILYDMLSKQDAQKVEARDNGVGRRKLYASKMKTREQTKFTKKKEIKVNAGHIHIGRNDAKYVDALLSLDMNICLSLKHITNVIEYGWSYPQYC